MPVSTCSACGDIKTNPVSTLFGLVIATWPWPKRKVILCADGNVEIVRALKFHPEYSDNTNAELLNIVRTKASPPGEFQLKISKRLLPLYAEVLNQKVPSVTLTVK